MSTEEQTTKSNVPERNGRRKASAISDDEVVELIRQIRFLARRALVILDLERHPIPYYFLPATRRVFGWSTLTLHDGPISVAAGFRPEELASLTQAAGASAVTI